MTLPSKTLCRKAKGMRPLFWNVVLCIAACVGCVVVALLTQNAGEDKQPEGFRLGVDLTSGPILVREAETTEQDKESLQEGDADLLAESLKHRINPNDLSAGRPVQVDDRPPPKAKITTAE